MKVSHGLLADTCKAAMSGPTEIYTLSLESMNQPTPGLTFVSEEALGFGQKDTIPVSLALPV